MKSASVKAAELRLKASELQESGESDDIYNMPCDTFDVLLRLSDGCGGMLNVWPVDILQIFCLFAAEFEESESC